MALVSSELGATRVLVRRADADRGERVGVVGKGWLWDGGQWERRSERGGGEWEGLRVGVCVLKRAEVGGLVDGWRKMGCSCVLAVDGWMGSGVGRGCSRIQDS